MDVLSGRVEVVNPRKIARLGVNIVSREERKVYRKVFDKRIVLPDGKNTVPYGTVNF